MLSKEQQQKLTAKLINSRGYLFGFIFSLVGNYDLADDLLQDTFVIICSKFEKYEEDTNFLAWAREIAFREAKGICKNKKYRNFFRSEEEMESLASLWKDTRQKKSPSQRQKALTSCLKILSSRNREILISFYEKKQTCQRIAGELNSSVSSVQKQLSRIREKLRICVQRKLKESF